MVNDDESKERAQESAEAPPGSDESARVPIDDEAEVAQAERLLALRNGVKLGMSLFATLVVAIGIRFWIPRYLGPAAFGQLHFGESIATAFFLLSLLGIDQHIRLVVARKPESASEFFGGVMLVRLGVSVFCVAALVGTVLLMGKTMHELYVVLIFAGWQFLFILNESFASLLQAKGTVNRLAIVNTATKILWGATIAAGVLLGGQTIYVAGCFLVAEAFKALLLLAETRRALALQFRWNKAATKLAIVASVPFFLNNLAHRVYDRIDVQMISVMVNDKEVGFYGAAANLALAALMFLPVLNAVVLPMGARIAEKSTEELGRVMAATTELVVVLGALASLMLVVYADPLVRLCFGEEYAPTALSLATLAPLFPLTYVAVLTSTHLIQLGKIWTVTKVSAVGLIVNPVCNYFFIPMFYERFGPGGAGFGAAATTIAVETSVTTLLFLGLDAPRSAQIRLVTVLLRTFLLSGGIWALHQVLPGADLLLGFIWVPAEVVLFVLVAWGIGILPVKMLVKTMVDIVTSRGDRS